MHHVLRKSNQGFPIFFSYDDFTMNRKSGMVSTSHLFHQAVTDPAIPFQHGKNSFAEYDGYLTRVDFRKRMKIAAAVEYAIFYQAVNVRMPYQKVAESLG
ncbi:MAG: hypothetical protein L6428_09945 [Candidatus Aminicenantes bacterium]|nr:hypothetical protein [Candidatus Aminicenantes bacterium]